MSGMLNETILLFPNSNQTELLRTLARHGQNTLGLRVMRPAELAGTGLLRAGIVQKEPYLTVKEQTAVVASLLNGIDYFTPFSYTDAGNITSAINEIRMQTAGDESTLFHTLAEKGEFQDKNAAMAEVYQRYTDYCEKHSKTDGIGTIRKAIAEAKPLTASIICVSEYPLTPLEQKLADTLSGGKAEQKSVFDLFGINPVSERCQVHDYTKAYGASNEAESILSAILREKLPLDTCTVAVTDVSAYGQLFYDLCGTYGIPVTFGSGVPISNSNPAALLSLLNQWNSTGYHGAEALLSILRSDAFNHEVFNIFGAEPYRIEDIAQMAGNLRLSFDRAENQRKITAYRETLASGSEENRILSQAEKLFELFEAGSASLIEKCSVIRKDLAGRIDRSAVRVIRESLDAYLLFADNGDLSQIVPDILSKTVCSENSREGCLYIVGIEQAMASLRENLFIAGLSAAAFPGSPRENYLILDSDWNLMSEAKHGMTSENKITQKKERFRLLTKLAGGLQNRISVSYPCYSTADLKEQNPSSVLFELYKAQYGNETHLNEILREAAFFMQNISSNDAVGKAYLAGKTVSQTCGRKTHAPMSVKNRTFSPSALENFQSCPRKFYLSAVLGIPEPETKDPFVVLDNRQRGILIHQMMERLANRKNEISKTQFTDEGMEVLRNSFLARPPLHPAEQESEESEFRQILENAWEMEAGNEVISTEEKIKVEHPSGITIRGIPDRVEKRPDGRYVIGDFKSGRQIKHTKDDFKSCLQTILYAYQQKEQYGYDVAECEYRYVRFGKTVTCVYDEAMQEELDAFLNEVKEALDSGEFHTKPDVCKYCGYCDICGREESGEEADT